MSEEKKFKQAIEEGEQYFVNFGGKILQVNVASTGYDYVEAEVIDRDETPEAMELKGRKWIIHFAALIVRKRI
ncbi:MAG: hypothetical protein RBS77_00480 [Candidatus Moranbacteria bacterium]|jgi:hypothetical protein|nr:hypothetical protein [Candidatus Moranbacteria bacterium]